MNVLVQIVWINVLLRTCWIFAVTIILSYVVPVSLAISGIEPSVAAHTWVATAILSYVVLMVSPWKRIILYMTRRGKHTVFVFALSHLGFVFAIQHIPDFLGLVYCGILFVITAFVVYEETVIEGRHDRDQEFIRKQH